MNENEIVVVSDAERALVQLDQEDLQRAPSLGIQRVKVKRGKFVLNDDLTAESLAVVILDHGRLNTLFKGPYVEGSNSPPDCYATHIFEQAMTPPDDVPDKQSEHCTTCWANQWESDKKGGKGKECKNFIRVAAVLPAKQPDGSWDGMLLEFQLAPTSIKAFEKLRVRVESYRKRALRSVTTRVSLDPASNYPVYVFEPIADIADQGLAELVLRYPLGPQTAIRQHLLRGWTYDKDEDAPVSTVGAHEQPQSNVEVEDDEIPF